MTFSRPHYRTRKNQNRKFRKLRPNRKLPMRYKVADMAYKGYKLATALASTINTEYKYIDVDQTDSITNTGVITLINGAGVGDGATTRDGDQYRCKSVHVKGNLQINASATLTFVKLIAFIAIDPKGAAVVWTDVMDDASHDGFRNLANRNDFVVLKEWRVPLNAVSQPSVTIDWYKELDLKCTLVGSGGAITDFEHGALMLGYISSEATNTPSFSFQTRVRFVDN